MSTSIPLSSIDRTDRYRETYKNIPELADSIKLYGLIQPLVLNEENGTYKLVAGGRRCKALELLGITEVEYGVVCEPNRAGYLFKTDISEETLREMEFEENRQREDTTWQENVRFMRKLERAYAKKAGLDGKPWGQRQAGMLLGVSLGRVNGVLMVADLLTKGDKEIDSAGSLDNALRILLGRKEDEVNKLLAQSTIGISNSRVPGTKDALPTITIDLGDLTASRPPNPEDGKFIPTPVLPRSAYCSETEHNLGGEEPQLLAPGFEGGGEIEIPLSQMLFQGDFRDVMKNFPDGSIDHVITDIPYGIDMDNLEMNDQERIEEAHDVEENIGLMEPFLREAFRVMKDKGFCCFWFDLDHYQYLRDTAEKVGFKVQRWPHHWVKTHSCRNQAATFNFTKAVEHAMILRKGVATLVENGPKNYIIADGSIERKLYRNPFAKPFEVWQSLITRVALKGQKILGPFAGGMSSVRAMINLGMSPIAIEKYPHHYNAGLEHIRSAYNVLTRNKAKFV